MEDINFSNNENKEVNIESIRHRMRELDKDKGLYWVSLGVIIGLIPGVHFIGIIILLYFLDQVRKKSLFYGYCCGQIDALLSSDYEWQRIKEGRLS